MRLYDDEKALLLRLLKPVKGEAYLFGSRADGQKTGGDIDLLILSAEEPVQLADQLRLVFLFELDSKLDVIVLDPAKLSVEQTAFISTLNKIRLH